MRKIYLFVFLACLTTLANAQSIGLYDKQGNDVAGDTLTFWVAYDSTLNPPYPYFSYVDFIDIINVSDSQFAVKILRQEVKIIPGTKDYLCWGSQCFGAQNSGDNPAWFPNDSVIVGPGDTAGKSNNTLPFQIYFENYNMGNDPSNGGDPLVDPLPRTYKVGEAVYQYDFYEANNFSKSTPIFIKHSITYLTSTPENLKDGISFELYPNPADNFSFVKLNNLENVNQAQIVVNNIMGQEQMRMSLQNNLKVVKLDHADLPSGIYFVSLLQGNDIIGTKKLIVR